MDMELVTNLVILATAVVGLYAVIGSQKREKEGGETGPSAAVEAAIATILSLVPVLLVPAALLGFMFLVNAFMDQSTNMAGVSEDRYELPSGIPDSEVMYLISEHLWDQGIRQDALHSIIEVALKNNDYETVLRAAKDLNPTSETDVVLKRALDQLAGASVTVPTEAATPTQ